MFRETNNQKSALVIPSTTSSNREYIPIILIDDSVISTNLNLIIPEADLFYLGLLESRIHMSWMRVVCGRNGNGYRYSKQIVYNNFPVPEFNQNQKIIISSAAQTILNARALYPDSTLADLYDPLTMPSELRKAHEENDKAVMEAYGFDLNMTEEEIVAELMKLYKEKVDELEK